MCRQLAPQAVAGLLREATGGDTSSARVAAWRVILARGFGEPTVGEPDDAGQQVSRVAFTWGDGSK
jgi:hypothetical protein